MRRMMYSLVFLDFIIEEIIIGLNDFPSIKEDYRFLSTPAEHLFDYVKAGQPNIYSSFQ